MALLQTFTVLLIVAASFVTAMPVTEPPCLYTKLSYNSYRYTQILPAAPPHRNETIIHFDQSCPSNTFWNEKECKCSRMVDDFESRLLQKESEMEAAKPKCVVLANLTYSPEDRTYKSANYAHFPSDGKKANFEILTITGEEIPRGSSMGSAMRLGPDALLLDSFNYNQLTGPWESRLRFRPQNSVSRGILLTDQCMTGATETEEPLPEKSLEVVFTGSRLEFVLRFNETEVTEGCEVEADPDGWYEVKMFSVKTDFNVLVNEEFCFTMDPGVSLMTHCPLSLGSTPTPRNNLIGALDFFYFFKNPKDCEN